MKWTVGPEVYLLWSFWGNKGQGGRDYDSSNVLVRDAHYISPALRIWIERNHPEDVTHVRVDANAEHLGLHSLWKGST
jgi:hypothetical protein